MVAGTVSMTLPKHERVVVMSHQAFDITGTNLVIHRRVSLIGNSLQMETVQTVI